MTPTFPAKICALSAAPEANSLRLIYFAERVCVCAAMPILAPIALVAALAIWLLSGRNPLISHARVGWRGAPLRTLKFRTMWGGPPGMAEAFVPAKGKTFQDPRVTSRFAAFCRRYSIDEVPQLWHVACGEMSFVGPRPITSAELETHYRDNTVEVLSVRPGLTGLWQIMGRSRLTYAQRRRLDLLLVRRLSAGLYVRILLRSIPKVLTGAGAW